MQINLQKQLDEMFSYLKALKTVKLSFKMSFLLPTELAEGNFTEETSPPVVPSSPEPPEDAHPDPASVPGGEGKGHPHLVEVDIFSKEKGFVQGKRMDSLVLFSRIVYARSALYAWYIMD